MVNEGIWIANYNILMNEIFTCALIWFVVMHFWNWTTFPQRILNNIYYIKHIKWTAHNITLSLTDQNVLNFAVYFCVSLTLE